MLNVFINALFKGLISSHILRVNIYWVHITYWRINMTNTVLTEGHMFDPHMLINTKGSHNDKTALTFPVITAHFVLKSQLTAFKCLM